MFSSSTVVDCHNWCYVELARRCRFDVECSQLACVGGLSWCLVIAVTFVCGCLLSSHRRQRLNPLRTNISTSQQDDTGYAFGYGFFIFFILKWIRNVYLFNGITSP